MKIISWNVYVNNKSIKKLLKYVLNQKPNIVCFQEFPINKLDLLYDLKEYNIRSCYDMISEVHKRSMMLVTLVHKDHPIKNHQVFNYFSSKYNSFLRSVVYKHLGKRIEKDDAIIVELNNMMVINARLSAATGQFNRKKMIINLLRKSKRFPKPTLICGDLNTADNFFLKFFSFPIRGHCIKEVFISEIKSLKKLLDDFKFVNPFDGKKTLNYKLIPKLQLDYILVPEDLNVNHASMGVDAFTSDHKMLKIEVEI